jgi:hypothetical protein
VLRHKNNQITFLHVYHHVSTLILGWTVANYAPGNLNDEIRNNIITNNKHL